MKICLLTYGAYPVPAAEGGAVENLVEIMAENYQQGSYPCTLDVISVYSRTAAEQAKKYPAVAFHYIKYSHTAMRIYKFIKRVVNKLWGYAPTRFEPYFSKALRIIRKNNYDVVVVENNVYFVPPLKKHFSGKTVMHLHNDFATLAYHKPHRLVRGCDLMLAVSDFAADNARRTAECDYPVVTVKNAIDTARFAPCGELSDAGKQIRARLGFDDRDTVCLFAGRLVAEKGIDLLIEAMSLIRSPHIKLMVVGGTAFADSQATEFEQKLLRAAERLDGRVVFTGYVDYRDIAAYYSACDIAVFPSQCHEAAGLVLLEAQSAGKPVVASYAGGMPEYVCDRSAIMVPMGSEFTHRLADAINTLGASPELRERMGNAGIAFAAQHDKDGYFGRVLDAVNDII